MKDQLLALAIGLLHGVDISDIDAVQINHTDYDDGSAGVTIDITFPAKESVN